MDRRPFPGSQPGPCSAPVRLPCICFWPGALPPCEGGTSFLQTQKALEAVCHHGGGRSGLLPASQGRAGPPYQRGPLGATLTWHSPVLATGPGTCFLCRRALSPPARVGHTAAPRRALEHCRRPGRGTDAHDWGGGQDVTARSRREEETGGHLHGPRGTSSGGGWSPARS